MLRIVAFDFKDKTESEIPVEKVEEAFARDQYCWIDADSVSKDDVLSLLDRFELSDLAQEEINKECSQDGRFDVYPHCVHFSLTEIRRVDGCAQSACVNVVLTQRGMITLSDGHPRFMEQMRSQYADDFLKYAQSPGFLLYELADRLIEVYRQTLLEFSQTVEVLQAQLFGEVEDEIFSQVSKTTGDLLQFRRMVLAARDVVIALASRKSNFVAESTQPHLERMAERFDRLSNDITSERDVVTEMLNLYLGIVSHRTNKVVNRLTVISTVFLPLAFLCGVYGMNFEVMPELGWRYGYLSFWGVVLSLAGAILLFMKRKNWF